MEAAIPPANVYEGNGQLSVAAPIPGAHPEHVEVVVTPTQIRIAASCKYAEEARLSQRQAGGVGAWERGGARPKRVARAAARATLNLGVLVVMAPISETGSGESRPPVT